jgi:hypothetical protein
MLSVDEARSIAAEWRAKFVDETNFETSWSRYFSMVHDPDPDRLEEWLGRDQARDAVANAGIVREPVLPTRSRFELGDCPHCGGKSFVRKDLPIGHPDFGKAFRCPACNR